MLVVVLSLNVCLQVDGDVRELEWENTVKASQETGHTRGGVVEPAPIVFGIDAQSKDAFASRTIPRGFNFSIHRRRAIIVRDPSE